eukprot:scaffold7832_cov106-Isochrysis_galbana.AAC.3
MPNPTGCSSASAEPAPREAAPAAASPVGAPESMPASTGPSSSKPTPPTHSAHERTSRGDSVPLPSAASVSGTSTTCSEAMKATTAEGVSMRASACAI